MTLSPEQEAHRDDWWRRLWAARAAGDADLEQAILNELQEEDDE